MGWFTRYILGPIAPGYALRRELAHRGLRAYYEAAEQTHHYKLRRDRRSGNAQAERAAVPIRTQARHLDENYDIASGVLDVLVANTVGRGIQPEPQVMNKDGSPAVDFNRKLLKRWDEWIYACDVTGQHHYYSLQRLMARSWFRDGEVFAQRIIGNVPGLQHGTVLPYSLEALEADFVPNDYTDQTRGIVQGIQVNAWGRPRGYWVYKQHPGDSVIYGVAGTTLGMKFVPAEVMLHLAFRKRLHQLRGISIFAPVIRRFDDLKETDENERIAARIASSMAAVIKKGTPDLYNPDEITKDEDGRPIRRELFFEAGLILDDLLPGESIETIDTKRPNNQLIPFRDSQLRSAAAGAMVSYSSASKNYNGTYSAQRQELVEQWAIYQMLCSEFIYRTAQPVWDSFIDAVLVSGSDEVPREVDRSTLYDATHTGPVMVWIDPEKEANALVLQMKWGLKARSRIIRERGDNPDQVNQEILRDQNEIKRLGLELIGDSDRSEVASVREEAETYGIAVRSGSITPQIEDEEMFRRKLNLPQVSERIRQRWQRDGETRQPVTLRDPEWNASSRGQGNNLTDE